LNGTVASAKTANKIRFDVASFLYREDFLAHSRGPSVSNNSLHHRTKPDFVAGVITLICVMTSLFSTIGCGDDDDLASDPSTDTKKRFVPEAKLRFEEMTEVSGVKFAAANGEEAGHASIMESLGSGVALFDYDLDGDLDLYMPGGGTFGPNEEIIGKCGGLFRNDGDWKFTDVTVEAGLSQAFAYTHGVSVGDYDSDGAPDFVVVGFGRAELYHNNMDGTFDEVGAAVGLVDDSWGTSAAWGDFNQDGHLDLYIAHYMDWSFDNHPFCAAQNEKREICPPRQFKPLPDVLFFSNGDGTFRDGSQEAGLTDKGKSLGVTVADIDLDGDLDIYVTSDGDANLLYINDGKGVFNEFAMRKGVALNEMGHADGSMGVDLGDIDGNGLPDLWVTNFENQTIAVYEQQDHGGFRSVSRGIGVAAVGQLYVGWGTALVDFDRDTDLDTIATNGHVVHFPVNASAKQSPLLFENIKGKWFANIAKSAGKYFNRLHMGRGLSIGDIDNDGDIDVAISHTNANVSLLSNTTDNKNHWVSFRCIGTQSHRDAVGAIVRVTTELGTYTSQVKSGRSYASSCDSRLFFGLGTADKIKKIEITWPTGAKQTLDHSTVDREYALIENGSAKR
jgi:enediyne biosynthesis protein E4